MRLDLTEGLCKTLPEAIQDVLYLVTPDMQVAFVNEKGASWFNKPVADIVGQHLSGLFDPDMVERHLHHLQRVFDTGEPNTAEYCYPLHPSTRWLTERFFPVEDADGATTAVLCLGQDITEQKQIRETLEKSHKALLENQHDQLADVVQYLCDKEAQYRLLAEKMRDGLVIQDTQFNIVYASPSVEELFGYTPEELRKLKMYQLVTAESLKRVESSYTEALSAAQDGTEPDVGLLEFEYIRKDGCRFWGEFHPAFVRDSDGNIIGSQGIIRDVTARKQDEAKVATSEAFLANIFTSIKDGISILSTDLSILRTNQTMENWYSHAMPLVGRKCYEAYHDRDRPCEICPTRTTIETAQPAVEIVPKAGPGGVTEGWVELFTYPFTDIKSGQMIGIIEYVRDITLRKKAEEDRLNLEKKIQHAQKLESLGILAGGIAHDFNNLLVGVLGNAEMALLDLPSDSLVRSYLLDIQTASNRLVDLSNQMLAYSGKGKFVVKSLNLTDLVKEMIQLLRMSISKKLELRLQLDRSIPSFKGDHSQIRQVIMNLITNAAEACEDGTGTISLATSILVADRTHLSDYLLAEELPEGNFVMLEVSDTGCGMDRDTKERIFDPFFSTKFKGRGLGLATVMGIIRSHFGAIKYHSEPHQGTTVKVLFPIEKENIQDSPEDELLEIRPFKGTGKVLLVDDEDTVLTTGRRMLERLGFTVLTATDGEDGLRRVHEHAHDLVCVLLDLTMPKMDGIQVAQEIGRIRADLPVILCSGFYSQEIQSTFVGSGITSFLQKPFRYQKLIQLMQDLS